MSSQDSEVHAVEIEESDDAEFQDELDLKFKRTFKIKPELQKYFEYLGHSKPKDTAHLKCKRKSCAKAIVKLSKSSYFNAYRHYQYRHQMNIKKAVLPTPGPCHSFFELSPEIVTKRESKQQVFDESILELLAEGGIPFNLVESRKFKKLVSGLDKHINVKSRRTYVNQIKIHVEDNVSNSKKVLYEFFTSF